MENYTQPLISVVMATYNGAEYLSEQLESLLSQTYPNMEIVICDDASTDGTSLLLASYAAMHSYIRVYHNKENLGYIRNFERAITLSSGSLVALCDQDDYWFPEKLAAQYASLGESVLVYCDSYICHADLSLTGKTVSSISNCNSYNSCLQQAVFCRIYGNTMLFKKSILQSALPFPSVLPHDWWIAFIATCKGNITYCNEKLVKYRQHENNLIGAATGKSRPVSELEKQERKAQEIASIRDRMQLFYDTCPLENKFEKKALEQLNLTYRDFSIVNNFSRMRYFFKYRKWLLSVKKRSPLRNWLFCTKMFAKIK